MSVLVNAFRIVGKKSGKSAKPLGKQVAEQAKETVFSSVKDVETQVIDATKKGQVGRLTIDGNVSFFRRIKDHKLESISMEAYEKALSERGKSHGFNLLETEAGKRLDVVSSDLKDVLKTEAKDGKKNGRRRELANKLRNAIKKNKSSDKIDKKLKNLLEHKDPKTIGKEQLSTMVGEFKTTQTAAKSYEQGVVSTLDALQASRSLRHHRKALVEALEKQHGGGRKKPYGEVLKALSQGKSEADVRAALSKATDTANGGKAPKGKLNADGLKKLLDDYFKAETAAKPFTDVSAPHVAYSAGAAGNGSDLLTRMSRRLEDIWNAIIGKR
ncbi:MAG: hypothetical protein IPK79_06355 [Vampirovibrionales bacterium]|nr:hypothetical protein [Vampirovibrionales bacterium]